MLLRLVSCDTDAKYEAQFDKLLPPVLLKCNLTASQPVKIKAMEVLSHAQKVCFCCVCGVCVQR